MKKGFVLSEKETDGFVSVVNSLIEKFCEKYPDEYNFDDMGIGFTEEGEIVANNGDDLYDVLFWVNNEIIPNLCK